MQLDAARRNATQKSEAESDDQLDNYVKQLRTVYLMIKRNIPADVFCDFMELQVLNGAKCENYYKSSNIVSEFEQCILEVTEAELLEKIKASNYVGIMLDESCDISVEKKLAIYVRFIENGVPSVAFIGNKRITDCTAGGIEAALVDFLSSKGISDEHFTGVFGRGTDGAPVMTGRLNGLGAKLKARNPHLIAVHCVAHRLNLAVSQAAKGVEYCNQYHEMIHTLYRFFADSSVRYDKLRELQTLLHGKAQQISEPTSVRWLSIESVVKMIFRKPRCHIVSVGSNSSDLK